MPGVADPGAERAYKLFCGQAAFLNGPLPLRKYDYDANKGDCVEQKNECRPAQGNDETANGGTNSARYVDTEAVKGDGRAQFLAGTSSGVVAAQAGRDIAVPHPKAKVIARSNPALVMWVNVHIARVSTHNSIQLWLASR
jgi:hypothetical protein